MSEIDDPCPSRTLLAAYGRGELPGDQAEHLARHLRTCEPCGAFTASFSPAASTDTLPSFHEKPAPIERPPAFLGRFRLEKRLGQGGFGTVHQAFDPKLQRSVALKVLRTDRLENPQVRERFLREAQAAARLQHPHIVPLFEFCEEDSQAFLVSALIEGESLADRCRRKLPSLEVRVRVTVEIAEALDAAHRQGIVHRDVKPGNVLLDRNDRAYLADFGLAFLQGKEDLTQEGAFLGTPAYSAPEQATGRFGPPTPAADQFSLGVLFYELLCGSRPFAAPRFDLLIYRIVHENPVPPDHQIPELPPVLSSICLRMLAKDPAERFPSCAEAAAALKTWLRPSGKGDAGSEAPLAVIVPVASAAAAPLPVSSWSGEDLRREAGQFVLRQQARREEAERQGRERMWAAVRWFLAGALVIGLLAALAAGWLTLQ